LDFYAWNEKFGKKYSYLMQAVDLFFDSKCVFEKLANYSKDTKEAYENFTLATLNTLKLI